uniref:Uncharacterized protein n=1 Tax=viral metagenome TaxID=1070528 RepID=A0A6M3IKU9_9ZZZZ
MDLKEFRETIKKDNLYLSENGEGVWIIKRKFQPVKRERVYIFRYPDTWKLTNYLQSIQVSIIKLRDGIPFIPLLQGK